MTRGEEKAKRWRPRFSIRTLAIVVMLVCAYFGTWDATKKYGLPDHKPFFETRVFLDPFEPEIATTDKPKALMPFLVRYGTIDKNESRWPYSRSYYLWLLGPKIKLPWYSQVSE